jgi:plastocyanin
MSAVLERPLPHFARPEGEEQDVFGTGVAALRASAAEIAALSQADDLVGAAQAFEELRATCVSCHLRFRSNNGVRGNYPARANTVFGTVELADADGAPRADRAWVLAFLEGDALAQYTVHARANPRVGQSGRRFHPRVLAVTVGTTIDFPNDDTIFHNVFSLSSTARFDLGVYEPGTSTSVRMERTGLVRVYCNIHPEMAASIVVLGNPFFALTDGLGRFVICGVPDGDYVLRGWNDMGAEARTAISLRGGEVLEPKLVMRETRRSLAHDDKHGQPYRGKYR